MKKIHKSLGGATGQWTFVHKVNGIYGPFSRNTKRLCWFFPIVPKISDHSLINAPKLNAEENCKKVNVLSRKLHFCKNCYIWGKAIAGTAKTFP